LILSTGSTDPQDLSLSTSIVSSTFTVDFTPLWHSYMVTGLRLHGYRIGINYVGKLGVNEIEVDKLECDSHW